MLFLTPFQALEGIAWGIAAFTFKNIGYVLQKAGVKKSGLERYDSQNSGDGAVKSSDNVAVKSSDNVAVKSSDNVAVKSSDNVAVKSSDNVAVKSSDNAAVKSSDNVVAEKNGTEKDSAEKADNGSAGGSDLLKTPIWWIGLLITNFGALSLIIAYGTHAPVTLIMPFMGLGLVISVIFCKYYLKEDVSRNEWFASFVIILGIVFISLVYKDLPKSEDALSFYFEQYIKVPSLIFFLLAFGGIAVAIAWSKKNDWKYASIIFGIAAGDVGGTTLIFQTPFSKGLNNIGALQGIDIAYFTFGLLFFAIGGVFAVLFLNVGYMHGEGILVAPLYATTQMLFPIIGGIVVYGEWESANSSTIAIQLSGIIIISIGVFILSYFNEKKRKMKLNEINKLTSVANDY